jgi:beta-glucosidase
MTVRRSDFPADFIWGAGTSSYQIEGAAFEDGRGASIWDRFARTPGRITAGSNGDIACDHYHRYRDDVALMQSLNLQAYRFSIAWPRIIPHGTGAINQAGLDFYSRLVDALLEAGIQPIATLFHWDLPQALQDQGGWANRDTAYAFIPYTEAVVRKLGDRVKMWSTHTEPWCTSFLSHQIGMHAPGLKDFRTAVQTSHHLLLSHGLAVPVIRQFCSGASVGLAPNFTPAYPAADRPEDIAAARRFDGWFNRWFADPLAGRGYPQDMWDYYGADVPQLQPDDLEIIAAPLDWLGVNYYNHAYVVDDPGGAPPQARSVPDARCEHTADREIYPEGLYDTLLWLHRNYHFPALYITENGAAYDDVLTDEGRIHDEARIRFFQAHFEQAARALKDGVNLKGYLIWSVMDNFEWSAGYTIRYGVCYTDYVTQRRYPKDSALWYRDFIAGLH